MSTSGSPLIDAAKALHEHFTKFMSMIPTLGSGQSDHDKEVGEMNEQLNAHRDDAANASFQAAAQKMKGTANAYDSTQKQPLKSYSK